VRRGWKGEKIVYGGSSTGGPAWSDGIFVTSDVATRYQHIRRELSVNHDKVPHVTTRASIILRRDRRSISSQLAQTLEGVRKSSDSMGPVTRRVCGVERKEEREKREREE
jgi:hypothetical protein